MSILDEMWDIGLDMCGNTYGVLRRPGEADDLYRDRIRLNLDFLMGGRSREQAALEIEVQRANDLELAVGRWKKTSARQEALTAKALDKADFWRRRCCELEGRVDDLTERLTEAKAKLDEYELPQS